MTPLDRYRRLLGLAFLGMAAIFTVVGFTWMAASLEGVRYVVFWMVPMVAAMGALVCALIDLRVVRRRYQAERSALARQVFGRGEKPGDKS